MSQRPIMDAGPGINFFSLNKERMLFATLGALAVPETVEQEILRKSRQDKRFAAAHRVMGKIPPHLLEVLSDDVTDKLAAAVHRIAGIPIERRTRSNKDLGEIMVIAHATVAAEAGHHVITLIDDEGGRRLAALEAERLERLRTAGTAVGSLRLISTVSVLKKAAGGVHLPDRNAMRDLYGRLRGLDDGLVPLTDTGLMNLPCWS
ncbi:hypothetical protein [Corynebacterium glyciniphilum]|uniref:hypothetical protein n=1 Tax=Corynebacterium glyciniphilum TaxID=1404244 RepID=UPI003FD6BADD